VKLPNRAEAHDGAKRFLRHRQPSLNDILEAGGTDRQARLQMRIALLTDIIKQAGPNFDYGYGAYDAMNEGKKMKNITDFRRTSPGAFLADDNADHMLPPKEHGTNIYDWKNSPYQGKPKSPKHDINNIDFPIDEQLHHNNQLIYPEEASYQPPQQVGSEGKDFFPGDFGSEDYSSYNASVPAGIEIGYTSLNDQDGKGTDALNFGYDYDDKVSKLSDKELQDRPRAIFLACPMELTPFLIWIQSKPFRLKILLLVFPILAPNLIKTNGTFDIGIKRH
jgi:hypothetical protein